MDQNAYKEKLENKMFTRKSVKLWHVPGKPEAHAQERAKKAMPHV